MLRNRKCARCAQEILTYHANNATIGRLLDDLDNYLVNPIDGPVLPDTSSASHTSPSTMDVGTQTDPVVILPAGSAHDDSDTDTAPDTPPRPPTPYPSGLFSYFSSQSFPCAFFTCQCHHD
ncbi:hypothetical protein HF521_019683 [Silurus meridionalis]|uniref:Uncharacterized protein n=1 Tax=Silurus meridionalis TaxID=175797 RepID=A0A8T0BH85_SILME|nr:hypothetical protein HF521_019683 [Silurus meridionalis]